MASSSISVPCVFDVSSNLSQNLKLNDNGKPQFGKDSKVGLFGVGNEGIN